MKKLYTLCISLSLFSLVSSGQGLDGLVRFSSSYFRSDPFAGSFSSFLHHLLKDPTLKNKMTRQRTDSSLFYFEGVYQQFNPFFFKPERVQVVLDETPLRYGDSTAAIDTVFIYQLIAYAKADKAGTQDIKKEFDKIHRQYKNRFFETNYNEEKDGDNLIGATHNYFVAFATLSPLSVSWGPSKDSSELALVLTLRLKIIQNQAALPTVLYNTQRVRTFTRF